MVVEPTKNKKRPTNLEMANAMYKDAFVMKKERIRVLFPKLTEDEIHEKTLEYFRSLHKVQ